MFSFLCCLCTVFLLLRSCHTMVENEQFNFYPGQGELQRLQGFWRTLTSLNRELPILAEESNGSSWSWCNIQENFEFDYDSLMIWPAPLDQQYSTPSLTLVDIFSVCANLLGKLEFSVEPCYTVVTHEVLHWRKKVSADRAVVCSANYIMVRCPPPLQYHQAWKSIYLLAIIQFRTE